MKNLKHVKLPLATLALAGAFAAASGSVYAAERSTVSGFVNGYECATIGERCPVDNADPRITLQSGFVVQQADGSFHLMTGVPRDVQVRAVNERVQVTGNIHERYRTVEVEEFKVRRGVSYATVWSQDIQRQEREGFEELRRAFQAGG